MNFDELVTKATKAVDAKVFDEALELFSQALEIEPNNKKLMYNMGVCYIRLEKYFLAIDILKKAISYDKDYYNANSNLAVAYKRVGEYEKAFFHLMRVYKNHPNDADILFNLANTLSTLEEYQGAYDFYQKVITLEPDSYRAYYGIGLIYNYLLNFTKARQYFQKTLQLKPNYPDAFFAISLIQLRQKEYKNGWVNYEARWESNNPLKELSYQIPMYNGEDLKGKNILIQEEQGFGDNIQLIRYLDNIKEKKPNKIYVAVRDPLSRLFKKIKGIEVVGDKAILNDIDYILSLHSAPRIFQTSYETIPNTIPYLPHVKGKIHKDALKILNIKKPKIGFAHLGNPDQKNAYYKSINLELLTKLFEKNDYEFYSLQIDPQAKNKKQILNKYENVHDLSPYIKNFYDTATIFNELDMIITIDSALSHLAGAYGKKTILLAPKNHDWRWVNDNGISPWYPSVHVIVQENLGVWDDVLEKCKKQMDDFSNL